MNYFLTILALGASFFIGGYEALFVVLLLGILEVSLSFDNAVVNASVLKNMPKIWQDRFLTWGIAIAVFGMRLILPIVIVSVAADLSVDEVVKMAINDPELYKDHVIFHQKEISVFGGTFLAMVAAEFFFKEGLALGIIIAILTPFHLSAVAGLGVFVAIKMIVPRLLPQSLVLSGFYSFLYLEILDASFSLDGVIGAFALSSDIFIIMLGLGIGAIFIRSMTIALVNNKTLTKFPYLEHGAFLGIALLGSIMIARPFYHISEFITGGVCAACILGSLLIKEKKS